MKTIQASESTDSTVVFDSTQGSVESVLIFQVFPGFSRFPWVVFCFFKRERDFVYKKSILRSKTFFAIVHFVFDLSISKY